MRVKIKLRDRSHIPKPGEFTEDNVNGIWFKGRPESPGGLIMDYEMYIIKVDSKWKITWQQFGNGYHDFLMMAGFLEELNRGDVYEILGYHHEPKTWD